MPIGGNLSPMVEVTWFEKVDGSSQLVHLVNGSGHFGVSFYEPVKMVDLEIELLSSEAAKVVCEASFRGKHVCIAGQMTC